MADGEFEFTDEELADLLETFQLFDRDGNNSIDTDELGFMLRSLKQNPTEEELHHIIAEWDTNKNGKLEFDEVVEMMRQHMSSNKNKDPAEHLASAFKVFDMDGNGYISAQELTHILTKMGNEPIEEEVVNKVLAQADTNNDGQLDYCEFVKMMQNS